jgi:hypothetical protein
MDIPHSVVEVMGRMLQRDPKKRLPDGAAAYHELVKIRETL